MDASLLLIRLADHTCLSSLRRRAGAAARARAPVRAYTVDLSVTWGRSSFMPFISVSTSSRVVYPWTDNLT